MQCLRPHLGLGLTEYIERSPTRQLVVHELVSEAPKAAVAGRLRATFTRLDPSRRGGDQSWEAFTEVAGVAGTARYLVIDDDCGWIALPVGVKRSINV